MHLVLAETSFVSLALAYVCLATAFSTARAQDPDFDSDGFGDLAVGSPEEDLGARVNAGAVNVLYGSGSGLSAAGAQVWHLDTPGVRGAASAGDLFGSALAWGDFDADGFTDLAVGAFEEGVPAETRKVRSGTVHVLRGSAGGLSARGNQLWHKASPGIPGAAQPGDRFGEALAAGDFDGDGFADLAIGVGRDDPRVSGRTVVDAGAVVVLLGSSGGLRAQGARLWHQGSHGVLGAPVEGDGFGEALVAADFDGDGFADLAVGVVNDEVSGAEAAGTVNVLYGSANGLTASRDQLWHQDVGGIQDVAEPDDRLGSSLGAGDFDGDGFGDLAIAVTRESFPGGIERAGVVHVLPGSNAGLRAGGNQLWTQDSPGVADRRETEDRFGRVVTSGDFDGDGFDDLAITSLEAVVASGGNVLDAGAANVLYGSATGLESGRDRLWTQDSPGILDTAEPGDLFGYAAIAADYNGDGRGDLALAVPQEDLPGAPDGGAVAVLYGTPAGLSAARDQFWHQDRPGVPDAAEVGDRCGLAIGSP